MVARVSGWGQPRFGGGRGEIIRDYDVRCATFDLKPYGMPGNMQGDAHVLSGHFPWRLLRQREDRKNAERRLYGKIFTSYWHECQAERCLRQCFAWTFLFCRKIRRSHVQKDQTEISAKRSSGDICRNIKRRYLQKDQAEICLQKDQAEMSAENIRPRYVCRNIRPSYLQKYQAEPSAEVQKYQAAISAERSGRDICSFFLLTR